MPEEYFDVVYINFDKAILCGRITAGRDKFGCRIEASLEQVLTDDQKRQIEDLNGKHRAEMDALLSGFADREAALRAKETIDG